jgi:DNA-binding PadR family transcriptional regulator
MSENLNDLLPLSPATLHILFALAATDRHGYGIMQEIGRQSEGRYKIGPGTLYDNLQKLLDKCLVAQQPGKGGEDDPRRRYYRLTSSGRRLLALEITRLDGVVKQARLHLRLSPGGAR